jgi:hypothetical protein
MTWKAIGQSIAGTSHTIQGKGCDDAIGYAILPDNGNALVCAASDGAGSAKHAAWAAALTVKKTTSFAASVISNNETLAEAHIYALAEEIYAALGQQAEADGEPLEEYACTLLGCIITDICSVFFQVGDGAIVRNDGSGFYTPLWWPENGEYLNTTSFIIDDRNFGNLNITIIEERVDEVAIFTDGLQMLSLNMESRMVHQPFFSDLFRYLRMANDADKVSILNSKLATYLDSPGINERTDDDKTLFLATRLEG